MLTLKILSILIILLGVMCFPKSSYKMHLPWMKAAAVQAAHDYYYQNYSKHIRYTGMKIYAHTEQRDKEYFYDVYFKLKEEPECEFNIEVDYDIYTEQYKIRRECYLINVMNCRMKQDSGVKSTYGKKADCTFFYDRNLLIDEETTIEEIKENGDIRVDIRLRNVTLEKGNLKREARKIIACKNELIKNGYQLQKVVYMKNDVSTWKELSGIYDIDNIDEVEKLLNEEIDKQ